MTAPPVLSVREQQLFPEVAVFLDSLHQLGVTNLLHSSGLLQRSFELSSEESLHVLQYWQYQQANKDRLTKLIQGEAAE